MKQPKKGVKSIQEEIEEEIDESIYILEEMQDGRRFM
jgi:hypothetical protein